MTKPGAKVNLVELEVGTSEFAALVGKTPQWVRQLTRAGVLTQCSRGKYILGENLLAFIEHTAGGKEEDGKPRLADAKAEHEFLKKEKTKLQLMVLKGQLHDANDVRQLVGDMILTVKSKLLSLPTRVAPRLDGESTKTIETVLQKEVSDALSALVDYSPKIPEVKSDE